MKEPRMVQDYLQDILDAMDKAESFVDGLDLLAFRMDDNPDPFAAAVFSSPLEELDRDAGQVDSRLCWSKPGCCLEDSQ